jgi:uncharacterized protein (DUF305 family)
MISRPTQRSALILTLALLCASPALAQHAGHPAPSAPAPAAAAETEATRALRAANAAMHKDMDIVYSGDADVDFARAMIPHHQGAVEMAKIQLKFGRDPELRKLAEDIVAAQEKEIMLMQTFLNRQGAAR